MRVYRRAEFLKLPAGIVYCYASEPWGWGGMTIKDESITNDWFELWVNHIESKNTEELFNRLDEMLEKGASYPLDNAVCRNGCYEDNAVFLVYERADLEIIKSHIQAAIDLAV